MVFADTVGCACATNTSSCADPREGLGAWWVDDHASNLFDFLPGVRKQISVQCVWRSFVLCKLNVSLHVIGSKSFFLEDSFATYLLGLPMGGGK